MAEVTNTATVTTTASANATANANAHSNAAAVNVAGEASASRGRNWSGLERSVGGKNNGYNWAFAFAQMVVVFLIGVFALEGLFYWAGVGETEHLRSDAELGFKPFENKQITQRKEGFGRFLFNSYGMQNNAVAEAKPAGTLRVAVFGDSYVESLQVAREKNYTSLLAGELSARLGRPVETMNFGVSNYSVAQDYLRYLTLGRKFKPDLVVLAYRVGETEKLLPNPSKALAFVRPVFFRMADGSLSYDNSVVRDFLSSKEGKRMLQTGWLRQYSHIWGVIGRMQQTWLVACDGISGGAKGVLASLKANVEAGANVYLKTHASAPENVPEDVQASENADASAPALNVADAAVVKGAGRAGAVAVAKGTERSGGVAVAAGAERSGGVAVAAGAERAGGVAVIKGAETAKPVEAGNKIVADLKTREGFVNCYWPMMDAQLTKFAADCRADGASFLVLRTPMVHPGVYELEVNPLETERLQGTAKAAGAYCLNVDLALRHKVDAAKYPSYFHDGGHFAEPLHKFVARELANFIVSERILGR